MLQRVKAHRHYEKAIYWGKLVSITGSAQIIIQVVGFVSGVLIIRLLPVQEYALYTLANTMLGTMNLLADGGISTSVMAQGGRVWQDKEKLGAVLATGLHLRRKFAVGSLLVATPILIYLLVEHGASWLMTILIVASLIPAFLAALSDSLLEIVPKLHQNILPLQKNQLSVGVGRLILTGLTIFIFPWTFIAILANGIPRIYGNIKLRKISENFTDTKQKPDPEVQKVILKVVKRNMPGAIYYCISGQISIWLISIFGNTTSIAEIGAIGRIAVMLAIVSTLFNTLVIPRFSRIQNQSDKLISIYTKLLLIISALAVLIVLTTYLFTDQILWILGKNYLQLKYELLLLIISSSINLIMTLSLNLTLNRGWILNPLISISLQIIPTIIGCLVFNISALTGVLYMNILVALVQMIVYIMYGYYKLFNLKKVEFESTKV
ncbi:polysaccharide biosynthesis protein [Flavobacterium sp.]|uniref:polysaccharide biosynthesis protein n=1 Tax=Flavobacterium sp. TaxID=239 RepID=UPI002D0DF58D|nr:polysaccharide biosynthesis protein [Flavobacterium sp.]HSD06045.1 hypothetical protein [Flavobacterium sp.]